MTASVSVLLVFVPGTLSVFTQTVHMCVYVAAWPYIHTRMSLCISVSLLYI